MPRLDTYFMNTTFKNQTEGKKFAIVEASVMYMIATVGLISNLTLISSLIIIRMHRDRRNFFLIHQALINSFQSLLSIPIGMSFLGDVLSNMCSLVGGTYVTLVTISLFNIGAAAVTEAYQFEQVVDQSGNNKLSWTCIIFGFIVVWLAAIIIHLGITLIGSDAKLFYDKKQGCLLLQRSPRGYILYCMWILTVVMSLLITITYVRKLFKEIEKRKRIEAPFLCLSVIRDGDEIVGIAAGIQQVSQRIKVYLLFIIVFSCTWLPLFLVLITDRAFAVSQTAIRLLVLLAYSHPTLMPLSYFAHAANCLFRPSYELLSNYYNRIGDRFYSLQQSQNPTGAATVASNNPLHLKSSGGSTLDGSDLLIIPSSS